MKKTVSLILIASLLILLLIPLAGCSAESGSSNQDPVKAEATLYIVGTWKITGAHNNDSGQSFSYSGNGKVTFKRDGSCTLDLGSEGTFDYTWEFQRKSDGDFLYSCSPGGSVMITEDEEMVFDIGGLWLSCKR